jgi:Domain of unknown function (DUF397)
MNGSTEWIKATVSDDQTEWVELRRTDEGVDIRDSKDPDGPVLHYTPAEFAAWLDGAKKGEFDHLTVDPDAESL